MNLFEIDERIKACVKLQEGDNYVDTETGEIIDVAALKSLEMQRDKKIRNIACWIRNLDSDEKALAEQEKRFKDRKTACRNKKEALKGYLAAFLQGANWLNDEVRISWRESEAVEFESGFDFKNLPEIYLRYKDPEPNRDLLKKDLKAGTVVPGAALVKKNNLIVR